MGGSKPKVEDKDHDEDKSEVLGNLVKVVVLIWSASLLTFASLVKTSKTVKKFLILTLPSLHQCSLASLAIGLSTQVEMETERPRRKKQEDTAPPSSICYRTKR